ALVASSAAHAQMAGAPQMPDVREMSGIPRPDQAVPAGTLTVRVVQGELGRLAPKGSQVHLVGVAANGRATLTTAALNGEGRGAGGGGPPRLARAGPVAYYALATLGEAGLQPEVVSLPPEGGGGLMPAGRKLAAAGKPIGDRGDDATRHASDGTPLPPPGT